MSVDVALWLDPATEDYMAQPQLGRGRPKVTVRSSQRHDCMERLDEALKALELPAVADLRLRWLAYQEPGANLAAEIARRYPNG